MRDLEKILDRLKNRPTPLPPADFTSGVMELTQTASTGVLSGILTARIGRPLFRSLASPAGAADRRDFVLQLFIAAFGHLVLAATLALGLPGLDYASAARPWIGLQPAIFSILGAWLVFFGIVIWKKDRDFRRLRGIALGGYIWIMTLDAGLPAVRSGVLSHNPLLLIAISGAVVASLSTVFLIPTAGRRDRDSRI
jgi:hypothetical protein